MILPGQTPAEITPAILDFCRRLDPTRAPLHVAIRSADGAPADRPFAFLKSQVARLGGRVKHGWVIREYPGWYLEAVFHGVWQAPGGELVDIAPMSEVGSTILFLPDSRRTYQGERIPDQFHALSQAPDVRAVVADAELHARLRAEAESLARRERVPAGAAGRNDPCPCGSGLKYKKCCGRGGS